MGLQSERQADAITIKTLQEDMATLLSKLADAKATILYEEERYATITIEHDKLVRDHDEQKGKWLLDRCDLDRCRVTRNDLDAELLLIKSWNDEAGDEVIWCRKRLKNSEMAVLGMERAMNKS